MSDAGRHVAEAAIAGDAQDLYALTPGEFTGERDSRVRVAREAGDRQRASALRRLRKPTVAAWAVNLLVREDGDLVDQVLAVGQALREAQEGLHGEQLRALGRQRRELVAAVVQRARDLASEHGGDLSGAAEQQVAATLNAALADPAAAAAVTSGLLVKPLETSGMPSTAQEEHVAPRALRSRAATHAPGRRHQDQTEGSGVEEAQAEVHALAMERRRLRREAAQQRVADAEQQLAETRQTVAGALERRDEARSHVLHVEARIDETRRALAELEARAEAAVDGAEAADGEVDDAEAAVGEAETELEAARRAAAEVD